MMRSHTLTVPKFTVACTVIPEVKSSSPLEPRVKYFDLAVGVSSVKPFGRADVGELSVGEPMMVALRPLPERSTQVEPDPLYDDARAASNLKTVATGV
jgi:hypothetical protein